jgi:hypothetical protein
MRQNLQNVFYDQIHYITKFSPIDPEIDELTQLGVFDIESQV